MKVNHQNNSGFTLIETFTAIIILLIAILGPLTLLSRAISDGIYAQNKITASFLLQEGLDLTISSWEQLTQDAWEADLGVIGGCSSKSSACSIAIDDSSGDISFNTSSNYSVCLENDTNYTEEPPQYFYNQTGSACGAGLNTIFTRKIWFEDIPATEEEGYLFGDQIGKVAHVQVAWTYYKDPGRERIAESSTILLK